MHDMSQHQYQYQQQYHYPSYPVTSAQSYNPPVNNMQYYQQPAPQSRNYQPHHVSQSSTTTSSYHTPWNNYPVNQSSSSLYHPDHTVPSRPASAFPGYRTMPSAPPTQTQTYYHQPQEEESPPSPASASEASSSPVTPVTTTTMMFYEENMLGDPRGKGYPHHPPGMPQPKSRRRTPYFLSDDPYKVLVCEDCPARFARKHDLTRHRRIHTMESPYTCAGCERSYRRSDARKRHWEQSADCFIKHQERVREVGS